MENQPSTKNNKVVTYVTTLIATGSMIGILAAYASVKSFLEQQAFLNSGVLGLVDSVAFLGRLFGMIYYTLWPTKTPLNDYFRHSFIIFFSLALVPLVSLQPSAAGPILFFSFFVSGFSRSSIMMTFIIVSSALGDSPRQKSWLNIWFALGGLGDSATLLYISYLLKQCHLPWNICFGISLAVFLICSFIMRVCIEETSSPSNSFGLVSESLAQLKSFLKTPAHALWLLDLSMLSSIYYGILIWIPLYLFKVGFEDASLTISIMFPTFVPIGSALFAVMTTWNISYRLSVSMMLLGGVATFTGISFLGTQEEDIPLYYLLLAAFGIFYGGPYSNMMATEMKQLVAPEKYSLILAANNSFQQAFSFLQMILIGFLMKLNEKGFVYVILGTVVLELAVFLIRSHLGEKEPETEGSELEYTEKFGNEFL